MPCAFVMLMLGGLCASAAGQGDKFSANEASSASSSYLAGFSWEQGTVIL